MSTVATCQAGETCAEMASWIFMETEALVVASCLIHLAILTRNAIANGHPTYALQLGVLPPTPMNCEWLRVSRGKIYRCHRAGKHLAGPGILLCEAHRREDLLLPANIREAR